MVHIHRKESNLLQEWLFKSNRKPLIIRGARQVGKSYLVKQLASINNLDCIILNFEKTPKLAAFFTSNNPELILRDLGIYFNRVYDKTKTLLFLDEIQVTPEVIATLRYFYEQMPELPVVAAGSLLEFILEQPMYAVPVGRVEYFHLGPICFEDFVLAQGEAAILEWLQAYKVGDHIPDLLHKKCLELVKHYWIIGGMPDALSTYIETNNFELANNVKQGILQGYQEDFYKYGRVKKIPLLTSVFASLPNFIGQKIKYSKINPDVRANEVKAAINQLSLAKIIHKVHHTSANGIPLHSQINAKVFKLMFLDIGLLSAALGLEQINIIYKDNWVWINQGMLAEQFVSQEIISLAPNYKNPEIHCWLREKSNSNAEVDFVIQNNTNIIPIEVKAGKTGTLKSLHYFIRDKKWHNALRFNLDKPSLLTETTKFTDATTVNYKILSLPFYLSGQLKRLVEASFNA